MKIKRIIPILLVGLLITVNMINVSALDDGLQKNEMKILEENYELLLQEEAKPDKAVGEIATRITKENTFKNKAISVEKK